MIHPDDYLLQQYAYADLDMAMTAIKDHLNSCTICSNKVELYRQIGVAISEFQLPIIDEVNLFSQIKAEIKPYPPIPSVIPWQFTIVLFCLGFLLFWSPDVLSGLSLPPILVILIACLTGLIVLEYIYTRSNYIHKIKTF